MQIDELSTPSLLLDRQRMRDNLERMSERITALGCKLRPHVKTHKSHDVLNEVKRLSGNDGITVSTLHEARYFLEAGHGDILYAVGMTPQKVPEAKSLIDNGCSLTVITDNIAMAGLLQEAAAASGIKLPLLVELDVDGHRSGIDPEGEELCDLVSYIHGADNLEFRGVMTHAGGSYNLNSLDEIREHAKQERDRSARAASRIVEAGFACPIVSIGSTPTAAVVDDLSEVTEIRPGVYTFYDLFQVGLGVARIEDIALSVLTTVIGHQPEKGWVIVDAGWMAMSRDRGTASQTIDQGYGLVCGMNAHPLEDVIMGAANQEHGILMSREGAAPLDIDKFPVGSKWRVLPNHACATASQYGNYEVVDGGLVVAQWPKTGGW